MGTLFAIVGALSLAAIPVTLGWRRTVNEASMARAMGLSVDEKKFDPEKFAKQTGTGLSFNQLVFGFLAWVGGGFVGGMMLSGIAAFLFAIAGGLLYAGTLTSRQQQFRLSQAKDILRGLGVIETLLSQGKPLNDALAEAANAVGPDGRMVLTDLVVRLRSESADQAPAAVRAWTTVWHNPAVDIVGTALLTSLEERIEISPLVGALRRTLTDIIEVLSKARAAAKGIEWQARFLAIFPPAVIVFISLMTPDVGRLYSSNPLYLLPVLIGSGASYMLSTRMIRNGLSIDASMGLEVGREGEIELDRLGRVL